MKNELKSLEHFGDFMTLNLKKSLEKAKKIASDLKGTQMLLEV